MGTIDTAYFVFNGDSTVTFKPLNLSLTSHIYGETASNYAIKWKGTDVQDLEGNSLGTDAYSAVWTTAPLLQDVSGVEPRVDTTWSPGSKRAGEDVILKFSEPVKLGPYTTTAGKAILVGSGVNTYFDMWNNDYMVFNGDNTVTIKPYNISGYVPGKTYTIKLPPVNILDLSGKTLNNGTNWQSYVTSQQWTVLAAQTTNAPTVDTTYMGAKKAIEQINLSFSTTIGPVASGTFQIFAAPQSGGTADAVAVTGNMKVADYVRFNGDNTVTIDPGEIPFNDRHVYAITNSHYFIKWSAGSMRDLDGNRLAASDSAIWTAIDPTPPVEDKTYVGTKKTSEDITLTFSETVQKGTGTFTVYAASSSNTYDQLVRSAPIDIATTNAVVFNGNNTVTIKPNALPFVSGHTYGMNEFYYIEWGGTTIKDLDENVLGTSPVKSAIWGADMIPPSVSSFEYKNNSTRDSYAPTLTFTFSEDVSAQANKYFVVKDSAGAEIDRIASNDTAKVTVSGTSVSVTLAKEKLAYSTSYTVEIEQGAFKDARDNAFAGLLSGQQLANGEQLSFETRAVPDLTAPVLVEATIANSFKDNDIQVPNNSGVPLITLKFNEDIQWGDGKIKLVSGTTTNYEWSSTSNTNFTISGNEIKLYRPGGLGSNGIAYDTAYHVIVESNAITDLNINTYGGFVDPTTLNFHSVDNVWPSIVETWLPSSILGKEYNGRWVLKDQIDSNPTFSMEYSEEMFGGPGYVYLYRENQAYELPLTGDSWTGTMYSWPYLLKISGRDTEQVKIQGNKVTIDFTDELDGDGLYTLIYDQNFVVDKGGNSAGSATSSQAYRFTVKADTTQPYIREVSTATDVDIDDDLIIRFNQNIRPIEGNILLKREDGSTAASFDINDLDKVTFRGSTIIINPAADLEYNTKYYIEIAAGVIKDLSNNQLPAISASNNYSFTTIADDNGPKLIDFTPARGQQIVDIDSDIELTFSEAIQRGSGNIVIKTVDGSVFETISINDANGQILIDGNKLTINPAKPFDYAQRYYILIDPGAIRNQSNISFRGIKEVQPAIDENEYELIDGNTVFPRQTYWPNRRPFEDLRSNQKLEFKTEFENPNPWFVAEEFKLRDPYFPTWYEATPKEGVGATGPERIGQMPLNWDPAQYTGQTNIVEYWDVDTQSYQDVGWKRPDVGFGLQSNTFTVTANGVAIAKAYWRIDERHLITSKEETLDSPWEVIGGNAWRAADFIWELLPAGINFNGSIDPVKIKTQNTATLEVRSHSLIIDVTPVNDPVVIAEQYKSLNMNKGDRTQDLASEEGALINDVFKDAFNDSKDEVFATHNTGTEADKIYAIYIQSLAGTEHVNGVWEYKLGGSSNWVSLPGSIQTNSYGSGGYWIENTEGTRMRYRPPSPDWSTGSPELTIQFFESTPNRWLFKTVYREVWGGTITTGEAPSLGNDTRNYLWYVNPDATSGLSQPLKMGGKDANGNWRIINTFDNNNPEDDYIQLQEGMTYAVKPGYAQDSFDINRLFNVLSNDKDWDSNQFDPTLPQRRPLVNGISVGGGPISYKQGAGKGVGASIQGIGNLSIGDYGTLQLTISNLNFAGDLPVITYYLDNGASANVYINIANVNDPLTGTASINKQILSPGYTLSATKNLADIDGMTNAVFSYQWLRDGTAINGATSETYEIQAADEGSKISLKLWFTDDLGTLETVTTAQTETITGNIRTLSNQYRPLEDALLTSTSGLLVDDILKNSGASYTSSSIVQFDGLVNDDPKGTWMYSSNQGTTWTPLTSAVTLGPTARIALNPAANANGDLRDKLIMQINTAGSLSDYYALETSITSVNDRPSAQGLSQIIVIPDGATSSSYQGLTLPGFVDADGDVITISETGLPDWLVFNSATMQLDIAAGRTAPTEATQFEFTITASDQQPGSQPVTQTHTVIINGPQEAPYGALLSNSLITTDYTQGQVVGTLKAVDINAADTHTFSLVNSGDASKFTINGNQLTWNGTSAPVSSEQYVVTVKTTDQDNAEAETTFLISALGSEYQGPLITNATLAYDSASKVITYDVYFDQSLDSSKWSDIYNYDYGRLYSTVLLYNQGSEVTFYNMSVNRPTVSVSTSQKLSFSWNTGGAYVFDTAIVFDDSIKSSSAGSWAQIKNTQGIKADVIFGDSSAAWSSTGADANLKLKIGDNATISFQAPATGSFNKNETYVQLYSYERYSSDKNGLLASAPTVSKSWSAFKNADGNLETYNARGELVGSVAPSVSNDPTVPNQFFTNIVGGVTWASGFYADLIQSEQGIFVTVKKGDSWSDVWFREVDMDLVDMSAATLDSAVKDALYPEYFRFTPAVQTPGVTTGFSPLEGTHVFTEVADEYVPADVLASAAPSSAPLNQIVQISHRSTKTDNPVSRYVKVGNDYYVGSLGRWTKYNLNEVLSDPGDGLGMMSTSTTNGITTQKVDFEVQEDSFEAFAPVRLWAKTLSSSGYMLGQEYPKTTSSVLGGNQTYTTFTVDGIRPKFDAQTLLVTGTKTLDLFSPVPGHADLLFRLTEHVEVFGQPELELSNGGTAIFQELIQQTDGKQWIRFRYTPATTDPGATNLSVQGLSSDSAGLIKDLYGNDLIFENQSLMTGIEVIGRVISTAPIGQDASATIDEDTAYQFTISDFAFTDAENNALKGIKISSLPSAGILLFNGSQVAIGDVIAAENITNLTYQGDSHENGIGYSSFTFQIQDTGGTRRGGIDLDPTPRTFVFNVTATNDSPAAPQDLILQASAGKVFTYQVGQFTDPDLADTASTETLIYSASLANGSPLPAWLSFDAQTRRFSGTPPVGQPADLQLRVTAVDQAGASASMLITLEEVDKLPPAGPAVKLTEETDTGVANDNLTKNVQPQFTVAVQEDQLTVVIYRRLQDGSLLDVTHLFTAAQVGNELKYFVATGSTPLVDGEYKVFVRDNAGNQSTTSDSFWIDTAPPEVVRLDNTANVSPKAPGTVVPYAGDWRNPQPPVLKVDLSDPNLAINPIHLRPGAADVYVEIRDSQGNPVYYSDGTPIRFKLTDLADLAISGSFVSLMLKEPLAYESTYQLYIPEGAFVDPADNGSIVTSTARTTFTFTTEPYDIDGIDFDVEDAGSPDGDLNGDGIPDKLQTNVSALPWVRKEDFLAGVNADKSTFIALQTGNAGSTHGDRALDETIQIADIAVLKFDDPYFNGVTFPTPIQTRDGLVKITPLYDPLKFTLKSLRTDISLYGSDDNPAGRYFIDLDPTRAGTQVRAFIDLPVGGLLTDSYVKWNPSLNGGQGGWFEFKADGDLSTYDDGAEFVDFDGDGNIDRIVLTYTDGSFAGGDTDGIVNGEIADPGAPAVVFKITGVSGSRSVNESAMTVRVGTEDLHQFKVEKYSATWSISGEDASLFTIDSSGRLAFKPPGAPSISSPQDLDGDNVYKVVIEATDPNPPSYTATHALQVTVVNEAPVIKIIGGDTDSGSANEADNVQGTLSVTDLDRFDLVSAAPIAVAATGYTDGLTLTNSDLLQLISLNGHNPVIDNQSTNGRFTWSFAPGSSFAFIPEGEVLVLDYTVQATDSENQSDTHLIRIQITGTNSDPLINTTPGADQGSVQDDTAFVTSGKLDAVDPDTVSSLFWSIPGAVTG
ncbi:MAG: Ig-like domain-containing protein, partial [Candidatus Nanopelagicaceae bacterium]